MATPDTDWFSDLDDDIAGNEDSPTKQARGDSGKEQKLHW